MWELHTYGGGDFLRLVFNALASILGNDDYGVAITISALLGLLSVLIMGAFRKGELNIQWLIAVIFVYQIALVPKTNVIINDHVVPANSSVVSNVPLGISAIATIFSSFSNWATGAMETTFSMPNDIRYRGNGLLFANTLVEESTRFEFTSPQISANFSEFWKSCVYYDLLLGLYTWDDLVRSGNLILFFQSNTSQTRAFTYMNSSGNRSILNCRTGFNNELMNDYNNEIANATNIYGARLSHKDVDHNSSIARYASSMPVAFQYMTGMSLTNAEIIGQNSVANSLKRGLINFASEADAAAAAQDFALARAEQERKSTFLTMGQIAKKMLPIMQHIFESFIYAIFPFVMLMAMTPLAGKVSLGYIKAVLWVNLWPPLYAILNFAVSYYSADEARAAVINEGSTFSTGLSVMTNTGLGKVMEDYAAIAGYLSISIPMIAWLLVSMSGAMMAGLAGRIMQGYEQPVSKASDEATGGNVNLGNTKYMNTSGFQTNTSPTVDSGMIQERLGSGSNMLTTATGRFLEQHVSSGATSMDLGQSLISASQNRLDNAVSTEQRIAGQLSESNISALRDSQAVLNKISQTQGSDFNWSGSENLSESSQRNMINSAFDKWAEAENITFTSEQKAAINTGFSLIGTGASGQISQSKMDGATYQLMKDFTASEQFSDAVSNIVSGTRSMAAKNGLSSDDADLKSLESNYQEQIQYQRQITNAASEVKTATESLSQSEQFASTFKQNMLDKLQHFAIESGMSQSEFDQLLINANQGGQKGMEALETIKTIAIDGVLKGQFEDKDIGNIVNSINKDGMLYEKAGSILSDEDSLKGRVSTQSDEYNERVSPQVDNEKVNNSRFNRVTDKIDGIIDGSEGKIETKRDDFNERNNEIIRQHDNIRSN